MITSETVVFFMLLDLLFIAFGILLFIFADVIFADEENRPVRALTVVGLVFVAISLGSKIGSALPGTDATRYDLKEMVEECEVDIPRNQNCVIDINVRPENSQ